MLNAAVQTRWLRLFAPVVWLAIIQVFVISVMAASPELHECCHSGSHDSGHQCLATDFQAGSIDLTVITPIVAPDFLPVAAGVVIVSAEVRHVLPHHLCGSLLVHGPPAIA
ncbi:MAG: hypothetical protein ABI600_07850 [Luteolibacter sp.]